MAVFKTILLFFHKVAAVVMANTFSISLHFRPSTPWDLLQVHSPAPLKSNFRRASGSRRHKRCSRCLKCISLLPVCTASHPFWSPIRECSGLNHSRNDLPPISVSAPVHQETAPNDGDRTLTGSPSSGNKCRSFSLVRKCEPQSSGVSFIECVSFF